MSLFATGSNSNGQLGIGSTNDAHVLTQCIGLPSSVKIKSISCGANHTLLVTGDGTLWGCGSNSHGQLGPSIHEQSTTFTKLETPENLSFVQVSCGFNHSLALDVDGRIWAWGDNSSFQLGSPLEKSRRDPKPLLLEKVLKVAASNKFSVALLENGQVWIWGDFGSTPSASPFCLYAGSQDSKTPVDFAVGQFHVAILTDSPREVLVIVASQKKNRFGQLGILANSQSLPYLVPEICGSSGSREGLVSNVVRLPATVPDDSPERVFSGWSFLAVLMKSKQVIMWGRCDFGQVPAGIEGRSTLPIVVPALEGTKCISLGSESGMAVSERGMVSAWGWNEHGNCGTGTTQNIKTAAPLGETTAQLVATGFGHSFSFF
ncbi:regulator of chromosome condensation 1/beta-lactamase-inhibitor protein II [Obelidium mucronatum]|nr:regulator of chromosome condensation 1/beta-lactamase-inhibitor protein II [Obelidium mucronatum]